MRERHAEFLPGADSNGHISLLKENESSSVTLNGLRKEFRVAMPYERNAPERFVCRRAPRPVECTARLDFTTRSS